MARYVKAGQLGPQRIAIRLQDGYVLLQADYFPSQLRVLLI
jgi:hypothetical protein